MDLYLREHLIGRFIIAYTEVFLEELAVTAERHCPSGSNYIDEETLNYVYKSDTLPNFRSFQAYTLHGSEAHRNVDKFDVIETFVGECSNYETEQYVVDFFVYYSNPFHYIRTFWCHNFEICLYESLEC